SRHHKPSSVYDWLVTEADWISSGMDRKQYEEVSKSSPVPDHYIRERLSPVFEEVCLDKHRFDGFQYRYPLKAFTPEAMFPVKAGDARPKDQAASEYLALWENFDQAFGNLQRFSRFSHYLEAAIALLEEHFWAVPSATYSAGKKAWSDISLFDHLVTTAALAHVLLRYHEDTASLEEAAIRDREREKFLFINIDSSGIQKFIFDITLDAARGASRMLRARSFYINLLMEGVFRLICSELKLYSVNRLVDAGGRALILAPNLQNAPRTLKTLQDRIDVFCLAQFHGELTVNLSWLPARGRDLEIGRFDRFLGELNLESQKAKLRKLSGLIGKRESHLCEDFWNEYQPERGLCPVCGKRQAAITIQEQSDRYRCPACDRLARLGTQIASGKFLVFASGLEAPKTDYPVPGGYFDLLQDIPDESIWDHIWDISHGKTSSFAKKAVANYIPLFHEGDPTNVLLTDPRHSPGDLCQDAIDGIARRAPKTFHHIALSSLRQKADGGDYQGKPYLAVFKADVDNLGLLFAYGLHGNDDQGNRFTIGRYATFSRMMDRFFTAYLPQLFAGHAEYADTYTVFAGGDDLFLIGPWTQTFML
ncbi:MAG: type III-A CRISPR-associated protein Cas10/Csm1, partial [Smithellaceae bacterium]|nr:type III-A CRISPR-associated protein Cas10/Csm1 [Smithellaceae bacterium]